MKYHLVVSADERTWKHDRPVLFLGEWCRLYDRKHIWQGMDAIVAAPYGLRPAQKDADYAKAKILGEKLLSSLCAILNKYHNVKYSQRFWKILFGHWLQRYVDVILNRTRTLEQCLRFYEISTITLYTKNNHALVSSDSYSSIWAFSDDHWNNMLIARIFDLLEIKNISIDYIDSNEVEYFHVNRATRCTISPIKKYILYLYQHIETFAKKYLIRESDAFIINSYLPYKEVVKLQLALGQYPELWRSPKFTMSTKINIPLREKLTTQLQVQPKNKLEYITKTLLFELFPICYLEGFFELNQCTEQQSWPKAPRFIFTSNNFDTDEIFKLWTAKKTESGISYIVGQHGNNYGTHRYTNPTVEEETTNKFLTWGWTDGLAQHIPAFIFKTTNKKKNNNKFQGGLLLIELPLYHRITTWDSYSEFADYFRDQQVFISKLDSEPRKQLTIRLHSGYRYMNWNEGARWQNFDSTLKIETGITPIRSLIAQSRLVIHSYDSTGILETLSQNIPTLAFWQNGFDHLRESAKPHYQLLVDAGIVHFSSKSVAQKVNEIWDDVDGWWKQSRVQNARNKFCNRYAKVSLAPVNELRKILCPE